MGILRTFYKSFKRSKSLGYNTIYICCDIHETILKPTYSQKEFFEFYPFAKRTLQLLSAIRDFKMILWSSCSSEKLEWYQSRFLDLGINFDYLNSNPDEKNGTYANFDNKFYFSIGFDDKFGFNGYVDWFFIYLITWYFVFSKKISGFIHEVGLPIWIQKRISLFRKLNFII